MADIPLRVVTTQSGVAALDLVKSRLAELAHQMEVVRKQQASWGPEYQQRLAEAAKGIQNQVTALQQQKTALEQSGQAAQSAGAGLIAFSFSQQAAAQAMKLLQEAFNATVLAAVAYEKQLVQIEVLTGAQPAMVRQWGEALQDMAGQVGQAPEELAKALYFVASAGQTGAAALDIVRLSAQGTMIGMGETGDIAKALTSIMNAYSASNLQAGEAMDILLQTVRDGGAEADELAGTIGRAAGVAANFGIELEEVGAFIATFTRVIPSSAEAVTSLRQTILNLMAPSSETREELARLGLTAEGLRISIREKGLMATLEDLIKRADGNTESLDKLIPNVRALSGVMATAGSQANQYKDILFNVKNAHGEFDEAVRRTEETISARWDKIVAGSKSMALQVGEVMLNMAEFSSALLFGGLDPEKQQKFLEDRLGLTDPKPWNDFGKVLSETWDTLGEGGDAMGGLAEAHALETQEAIDNAAATEANKKAKEEAEKAAEAYAKGVARLTEEMRDGIRNNAEMGDALRNVGGVASLSAEQIQKYGAEVEKAARAGAKLTKEQLELLHVYQEAKWIKAWNDDLAKQRAAYEALNDVAGKTSQNITIDMGRMADAVERTGGVVELTDVELADFIESMEKMKAEGGDNAYAQTVLAAALKEAADRGVLAGKALEVYEENLKANVVATEELRGTSVELAFAWSDLLGLLEALGVSGDSSIGSLVNGFAEGERVIEQTNAALEDGVLSIGEMINLAAGLVEGFKNATDSASGISRALGGAAFGAQVGSAFGSLFGPGGQVVGAIGGALVGGVLGLFREPEWKKVGRVAGAVLGHGISEELAKTIEKDMEELGLSAAQAALLHISDAAAESGRAVSDYSAQLGALMRGVADGSLPAKEGLDELTRAFEALRDEGGPALVGFIQGARELGLEIPAVTAHVKELLDGAAEGLSALFAGIAMSDQDAAALFAGTFAAIAGEEGLLAAIQKLGPAWDELVARFEVFGPEALAILGPIPELMGLMGEATKPIISGLDAALQVLKGLGDSGYLTAGAFNAMQNSAQNAYDQLIENGATEQAALAAIAPLLAELQRQAELYGIELSDNTKKLIAQAEESGVAFAPDPMMVVVDLLREIVLLMGGELPESARAARAGIEEAFDGIEINIPVNYQEGGEVPGGHGGATGGTAHLPHAQHGIVLRGSAEGTPVVMGEKHTPEVGAPVAALLNSMKEAAVGAAVAAVSGGGSGPTKLEVHLKIGDQSFDSLLQSRLDSGFIREPKQWAKAR